MTSEEKKSFLLLKAVIFFYHGLNDDERGILHDTATEKGAKEELDWALNFIHRDEGTAFSRAREYFNQTIAQQSKDIRIKYMQEAWVDNNKKGYITEMEATACSNLQETGVFKKSCFK